MAAKVKDTEELKRLAKEWDYRHIPQWNLVPDSECNQSGDQSPIDIDNNDTKVNPSLENLKLNNPEGEIDGQFTNNGHSWQVDFPKHSNASINWNGTVYNLLQFHFHAPSENTVDGLYHDMEAHLVHRSEHGESLVLAQFFDVGGRMPNPYFAEFWEDFPAQLGTFSEDVRIDSPYDMLPNGTSESYYTWTGSLTTPPCTTGLTWILSKTSGQISKEQFIEFRDVLADVRDNQEAFKPGYVPPGVTKAVWDTSKGLDNRPVQAVGDRVIWIHDELANPSAPEASRGAAHGPMSLLVLVLVLGSFHESGLFLPWAWPA
jgi:carbonic anhydrase